MATRKPGEQEETGLETSTWVNTHILELSKTYGVALEGYEKETLALLTKLDERKTEIERKSSNKASATPRSRGIGKNELKNLQSSLNVEVEGAKSRGRVLSLTLK